MTWLAIKLFLGGAIKRLTEALTALLGWAARYPWQAAVIASLCLSGWLWRGRQAARVEAARWEQAFVDQKAAYLSAQAEAKSRQIIRDRQELAAQTALAAQVEQAHAANDTIRKNAVDAYARAHPVRLCRQAPASAPSGPGETSVPGDPGQPDEAPADADLVAITRTDLDHLAAKAMRDSEWMNWADALIKQGRAVKASDLPVPVFGNTPPQD
jgi:hypothetical protein